MTTIFLSASVSPSSVAVGEEIEITVSLYQRGIYPATNIYPAEDLYPGGDWYPPLYPATDIYPDEDRYPIEG